MAKLPTTNTKQSFTEFTDRMSAEWHLHTFPNKPSKVEEGESTESILADLVAMPTVTGNREANREALDYIDDFLAKRGMHIKRLAWNGVESLVATTRKTKTPTVFFLGHVDVVPAPSELFQMREQDGKLYGRGVLDMKGAVAAFLGVVRDLQDTVLDYDFGIMIVTDEEVGGFDGAARLAEAGYLPEVMIVPDGGSNWNLELFAKGICHFTIETTGKSAHGSRPWEGENAIDTLMAVIQECRRLFPTQQSIETNTINVGIIQGGEAINQIPASATASIDTRFASIQEQKNVISKIAAIVEKYDATLTVESEADAIFNDRHDHYLAAFAACTEETIGRSVEWITSNAAHDGRHFAKHGVPLAVNYPPGANHHGPEEYLEKASLQIMEQIFHRYLLTVARIPRRTERPVVAR